MGHTLFSSDIRCDRVTSTRERAISANMSNTSISSRSILRASAAPSPPPATAAAASTLLDDCLNSASREKTISILSIDYNKFICS